MNSDSNEGLANRLFALEDAILEACGQPMLPEMGVIKQEWETDLTRPTRWSIRQADAVVGSLSLADVPDCGTDNPLEIIAGVVTISGAGCKSFIFLAMGGYGSAIDER